MQAIVAVLTLLLVALQVASRWAAQEGFSNKEGKSLILDDPDQQQDEFQASFQDTLFHSPDLTSQERASFREILLDGQDKHEMNVLDLCCGTAPHACWFADEAGVKQTGLDSSEGMLVQARKNCPAAKFVKGDARQASTFPPKSFSHVLLLQNSVQQFPNPKTLADNAAYWLQPDGWCVVHAVHPDHFDPVIELASPFAAFSLQKQSDKRIVDSDIYFDQFKQQSRFLKEPGDDSAVWQETITFTDPDEHDGVKQREQKHQLTMPSIERLTDIFKASGFRLRETVDLVSCGREQQYLLYFQK